MALEFRDKKKSVLIMARNFAPYFHSYTGFHRTVMMCRYFKNNGFKVYVLASNGQYFGYFGLENEIKSYSVTYLNDFLKQRFLKHSNGTNTSATKKWIFLLKRWLNKLWVPDNGIAVVPRYFLASYTLLKKENIANVIVSSPPHSMQLVGFLLKKILGKKVNYVCDYRDSWNFSCHYEKPFKLLRCLSKVMEREVLKVCDWFTFVSNPMLFKIESFYKLNVSSKAKLIMNGFSMHDVQIVDNVIRSPVLNHKHIRVGYFGNVTDSGDGCQNVNNLLRNIEDLGSKPREKIIFEFYGTSKMCTFNKQRYPNIRMNPPVSHVCALELMRGMDYLLIIHAKYENSDEIITNKFFDYLTAKKPILCFGPPEMEVAKLISENRLGIIADYRKNKEIKEVLLWISENVYQYNNCFDNTLFSTEKQFAAFKGILA